MNSGPRTLSMIIGILGALMAAFLIIEGLHLIILGGSWFYTLAGIALAASSVYMIRRNILSTWIALGLLVATALWSLAEVGTSFWPSFSRLIVFLCVALIATLMAPWLSGPGRRYFTRPVTGATSGALGAIIVAFLAGMFRVHPTIAPQDTTHPQETASTTDSDQPGHDWPAYGRTASGTRYASFTQINRDNVSKLRVAWTYRTGDMALNGAEFQGTPIKIGDTVYICSPHNIVSALDPDTGTEKWKFDPHAQTKVWQRCRGVGYWHDSTATDANAPCASRIVLTTIDARLITIDARTGQACTDFGTNGNVNLLTGLGPTAPGSYYPTAAPLVAGDIVVVGGRIADNERTGEPSGVVRGYDVRTGAQVWAWDATNPHRGTTPLAEGEIYPAETPNMWGTASYDPKLNLVFFPLGNQTPDFWGGDRSKASDEYNDAFVAVDAKTGDERWHFRTANHDLVDYDATAQPILYDIPDGHGGTRPAIIAMTKRGQIFVLDRRDGTPIVPVEMRKVPQDGAPEHQYLAPEQPYSALSIGTERLKPSDMWGGTIFDQLLCRIQFASYRYEGEFTPVNEKQATIIYPGYYGGINWGGGAVDESTGTLLVNDIRMAQWGKFMKQEEARRSGFKPSSEGEYSEQKGTPWGVVRSMFFSPAGLPCVKPPYGTMNAIDLRSGKVKWSMPLGTIQDMPVHGMVPGLAIPLGMPTMSGPLATHTGLVFFSGTLDNYVRALNTDTGEVVWKARLPVASQAAPMSYMSDKTGKQYIVVTAGGLTRSGVDKNRGDYVIAYALPSEE